MEDKFDDIEIDLSEPKFTESEKKENMNVPPKKEEKHNCCGKNKKNPSWINGPFGCLAGGFTGCVIIPLIVFCIMIASLGALIKGDKSDIKNVVKSGDNYIAVIHVDGVMQTGSVDIGLFGSSQACGSDTICKLIRKAADDNKAKGIILRVDSPGGTPVAAEEIGEAIKYAKEKKPVYTSMANLGCSAAYWISALTDKIYVNKTTMTGSIGVIMNGMDFSKLMDKLGVDSQVIKSGKFKDIGSGQRPMTGEEKQLLQGVIDDTYSVFVDVVAEGRKLPNDKVKQLADGRIYTGTQAVNNKLADKIGTYNICLNDMANEVKMKEPVIKEMGKTDFWNQIMETDMKGLVNLYLINYLKGASTEGQLEMK